jgi:hypothetical protein
MLWFCSFFDLCWFTGFQTSVWESLFVKNRFYINCLHSHAGAWERADEQKFWNWKSS